MKLLEAMKLNHLHKITPTWLLITVAVFVSLIFCVAIAGAIFANVYKNKIMPGVVAGSVEIGTQSPVDARQNIEKEIERLQEYEWMYKDLCK